MKKLIVLSISALIGSAVAAMAQGSGNAGDIGGTAVQAGASSNAPDQAAKRQAKQPSKKATKRQK